MQNKIYCNQIMTNIYILEYVLEYLIDEKGHEIDNYKSNTNNPLNLHINYPIMSLLLQVKLLLNMNLINLIIIIY